MGKLEWALIDDDGAALGAYGAYTQMFRLTLQKAVQFPCALTACHMFIVL